MPRDSFIVSKLELRWMDWIEIRLDLFVVMPLSHLTSCACLSGCQAASKMRQACSKLHHYDKLHELKILALITAFWSKGP